MVEVVDYANIEETILNLVSPTGDTSNSSIPGINSPMIDAAQSVTNIPVPVVPPTTPDLVGWSTDIVFTADDYNTVSWSTGSIKLADGTSYSISSTGNTGNMTAITYIYYDGTTTLKTTTTPQTAVGANKIMVAVCKKVTNTSGKAIVQPFGTVGTEVFITADNIAANTITANEIASNTITSTQISSSYIYAGTINADNITSGTLTGRTVQTATTGQRVVLDGSNNRLRFYNSDGTDCGYVYGGYDATLGGIVATSNILVSGSHFYCAGRYLGDILPYSDNTYNLGSATYAFDTLYLGASGNALSATSSNLRWNGYYVPYITGASTNRTTNASIIVNIAGTSYYINVLAV